MVKGPDRNFEILSFNDLSIRIKSMMDPWRSAGWHYSARVSSATWNIHGEVHGSFSLVSIK